MLPLCLFCFWLQIYHYFCSWTAVAGSFGCHFGGFFHVAPHFYLKFYTFRNLCRAKAHTDTNASHLLFTCFVVYVHILHRLPAETCAVIRPRLQIATRLPGVEPGAQAWEACMLPLHYRRSCSWDISGSPCFIFFFESSARKSFDGLTSYQLHLTFVSHSQVTSNPRSLFHVHLSIGCLV